ncbi:hypothetical protein V9L05_18105 [Bernardetia sp. Wsw4-3y2]|uniref:hypothetical protein n=1 Tax=Bernardetia sp. Wsw4-3y2 TaxID=3127471 RepID=UPI0030CD441D
MTILSKSAVRLTRYSRNLIKTKINNHQLPKQVMQNQKPQPKDFGYVEGTIEEEAGWMLEEGEEEYHKALQRWNFTQEENKEDILERITVSADVTIKCTCYCPHCRKNNEVLQEVGECLDSSFYAEDIQVEIICKHCNEMFYIDRVSQ